MKACHTEVMKMIRELEEQKSLLLQKEDEISTVSYREDEKKIDEGYSYDSVRKSVRELDDRVRKLRSTLAKANCTVKVDKFNVTIGEALIMLAQLQHERMQVESLARRRQITRRITANGVLEFTECAYDIQKASDDAKALRDTINDLQMAIDRANLTNFVEV